MKRAFIYTILLILSVGRVVALPIEIEGLVLQSEILQQDLRYSVILPDGYESSDDRYAVLYMFHGIGGDHSSWLEYSSPARLMQNMVERGEMQPFIMVIPDGYDSYYCNTYDSKFNYESMLLTELLPTIDATYRTVPSAEARGVIGFSMGGFGALSVALRNRDCFSAVAALSPSIRTESQYCSETPQSGWDYQWGRIFGGVGIAGEGRLTEYYRAHSPFYILEELSGDDLSGFDIMLDTGDQEYSIARSSEELHSLMSRRGIDHTWEVRSGGHDFICWNSALPKAFIFFNENFEGVSTCGTTHGNETERVVVELDNSTIYYPKEAARSRRLYPTIYVDGTIAEREQLVTQFDQMVDMGVVSPNMLSFVHEGATISDAIQEVESTDNPVRCHRRMRALITSGDNIAALTEALDGEELFASIVCVACQSDLSYAQLIYERLKAASRPAKIFIESGYSPQQSAFCSELHSIMRDNSFYHQYRARQHHGSDVSEHWGEWIEFINKTKN